jgi:hypothetical protein
MNLTHIARRLNAARDRRQAMMAGIHAMSREIDAGIARQRIVREARADAAKRGHSTYWAKAGKQARAMFG